MTPALWLLPLLLLGAERLHTETRGDVRLETDLSAAERTRVFDVVADTRRRAAALLEDLGVRRKSDQSLRLRGYAHEADFEDYRRRTRDQSTITSPLSYYSETDREVVFAWIGGAPHAVGQLRRQVARQALLQFAKDPPHWFEEGFAGYFEGLSVDPYGEPIDFVQAGWLQTIRTAIQAREYAPLYELMDMQEIEFYGLAGARNSPWSRTLLYAQSWSLVFWMLEAPGPQASEFRELVAQRLDTGRWSQARFKKILEELEPYWRTFMLGDDFRRASGLVHEAWSALANQEAGTAAVKAGEALVLDPEHVSARRALAEALLVQGMFAEAATEYERLIELRPDDAGALLGAAKAFAAVAERTGDAGEVEKAIDAGRRAAARAPEARRYEGLVIAADVAERVGEFGKALELVREAMRLRGVPREVATELVKREQDLVKRRIGK